MKKPRFKIGEWVRANQTVTFGSDFNMENPRRIAFKHNGINGIIVGATTRFLGDLKKSEHTFRNGEKVDRITGLNVKYSKLVWQIRQGYSNKPYEALDEDVESLENLNDGIILLKGDIPFRFNNEWHGINGGMNRTAQSLDSQGFARDEKGRFV